MRSPVKRDLLILLALTLLIRLPFLDEAVQGDDVYYLLLAENARIDPWHPMQMGFRLQGETVWAAGHTRPPGNAYLLAGLLAAFDGVDETAFHAAYAVFSFMALAGVYFLARRFTAHPMVAALCLAAAPPFLVNGNKLESDLPLLGFLAVGAALLVHRRFVLAAGALAVAAFFGYQAVLLLPVFAVWVWREARTSPAAWAALASGPLLLAVWQLFERAAAGTAPVETLAGYFGTYGLLALERKWRSAQALQAHLGLLVSPLILLPALFIRAKREVLAGGALALVQVLFLADYSLSERALFGLAAWMGLSILFYTVRKSATAWQEAQTLPALWLCLFFAAAVAVFYAGSARYLLPLAPAAAILAANLGVARGWLIAGLASNFALGLALARAEFDYAEAYRDVVEEIAPTGRGRRVWSNAEWGLRHYLDSELGGDPLLAQQEVPSDAMIVESALAATIPYRVSGSRRKILEREIRPGLLPFRTIGPGSHAGYSSSEFGVLPFGIAPGEVDRVTVFEVGRPEPTLSYLKMNDPKGDEHLLGGFYPSDGADWRWMGPEGAALLIVPEGAKALEVDFHIPENAPARHIEIEIDGKLAAAEDYQTTGGFLLRAPVQLPAGATARVTLRASPSYTPPGDGRELAVVMLGFGFVSD